MFGKKSLATPGVGDVDVFKVQMTSFIDILTLLLVFLVASFSAEGNLITPSSDLQLPNTSSPKQPTVQLTVEITKNNVSADGQVIAPLAGFAAAPDLLIDNLFAFMIEKKKLVADTTHPLSVIIECDRDVEFNIVKRVMYTCSKAGYLDFSVLAVQE